MKIQCGTDIIEINRIKEAIEELGDNFKNKIYTKKEIEYCESKNQSKYQHYAVRFAAKEAIFKAISNFLEDKYEISWKDVQIENDEKGKPKVKWLNIKFNDIQLDLSLSHCKQYAVATVVAMKN